MKIYKLTSRKTDEVYVGKTIETLKRRFEVHNSDYFLWADGRRQFKSSYFLTEYEDVKIELIENANNLLRELYWIQKLDCCNFELNGDDYYISKTKDKRSKHGYYYRFEIQRNKKNLIRKCSTDKEYLRIYRDEWLENNQHLFIVE